VSQKHGVPIFEDDCYADLRFAGERSPAIQSLDDEGSVLYCGSFSKIVAPGMRLGFMAAPQPVIESVKAIHLGATPSQFSALATLYYLRDHLDEHVQELRDIFRAKKDTAVAAVVLSKARERQMSYGPGITFSPGQDAYNYLRLCYGHLTHETVREGIAGIASFFEQEGLLK